MSALALQNGRLSAPMNRYHSACRRAPRLTPRLRSSTRSQVRRATRQSQRRSSGLNTGSSTSTAFQRRTAATVWRQAWRTRSGAIAALHLNPKLLPAPALATVAEALIGLPFVTPQFEQRADRVRQGLQANRGGIQRVEPSVGPVPAHVEVVDVLGPTHQANITHVRAGAAVGTAGHADTQLFAAQSQGGHVVLK